MLACVFAVCCDCVYVFVYVCAWGGTFERRKMMISWICYGYYIVERNGDLPFQKGEGCWKMMKSPFLTIEEWFCTLFCLPLKFPFNFIHDLAAKAIFYQHKDKFYLSLKQKIIPQGTNFDSNHQKGYITFTLITNHAIDP